MTSAIRRTTAQGRRAFAGLLAGSLALAAPSARAGSDFGLLGIARGQTARLSVALCDGSVKPGDGSVRSCDGSVRPGVAESCRVRLGFVDARSLPLRDRAGRELFTTRSLQPGESVSVDLPAGEALAQGGARRSFRPVASTVEPPEPDRADACAGLVQTVELIDNVTGRTTVVYALPPWASVPPEPVHPED